MTMKEPMKDVCISCEGREDGIKVGFKGTGLGIIVGIAVLAKCANEKIGIPLETIARAVLESQEIGSLEESVTFDLSRLPPDLTEALRES